MGKKFLPVHVHVTVKWCGMTFVLHEISVKSEELVNVNYKEHVHLADKAIPQLKFSTAVLGRFVETG